MNGFHRLWDRFHRLRDRLQWLRDICLYCLRTCLGCPSDGIWTNVFGCATDMSWNEWILTWFVVPGWDRVSLLSCDGQFCNVKGQLHIVFYCQWWGGLWTTLVGLPSWELEGQLMDRLRTVQVLLSIPKRSVCYDCSFDFSNHRFFMVRLVLDTWWMGWDDDIWFWIVVIAFYHLWIGRGRILGWEKCIWYTVIHFSYLFLNLVLNFSCSSLVSCTAVNGLVRHFFDPLTVCCFI